MLRRCPQCARLFDATADGRGCPACGAGRAPALADRLVRAAPLVIEGEVLSSARPTAPSRPFAPPHEVSRMPTRSSARAKPARRPFAALAAGLALALAIGAMVPIAAAIPGIAALFSVGTAIIIERVESTVMIVGGENAIVVTGTLTNPSTRELPVPAVRLALKGGEESDAYARIIEPATLVLAPGASVSFRSTLKKPVSGNARVVVSLVPREQRIGMN